MGNGITKQLSRQSQLNAAKFIEQRFISSDLLEPETSLQDNTSETYSRKAKDDSEDNDIVYYDGIKSFNKFYNLTKRILGHGMNGTVYIIESLQDCSEFAFKSFSTEKAFMSGSSNMKSFQHELELHAATNHPNIVKLFGALLPESRGSTLAGLVLELGAGGDLYDRLACMHQLEPCDVKCIMTQMLRCLQYLHGKKIVHRDLKLENWVFSDMNSMTIKLVDFGLGIRIKDGQRLKEVLGSTYYVAPEVLKRDYDERCDIWSLGVVCFMMLTGKPPFDGDSEEEIFSNIVYGAAPIQDEVWWRGLDFETRSFIKKLLTTEAGYRISIDDALVHPWLQISNPNNE